MSRRSLTLAIAGLVTVAALAVAVLFPVPYVILTPGPTLNTLGEQSGQPLISITGRQTYSTSGHLNMVTISYEGGPGTNLNIFQALRAWLDPSDAVVPESELFPPGQSAQQTQAQDTEEMASSQELATAAALTQLHIGYQTQVEVVSTVAGYPASKSLKAGDIIEAVDGKSVTGDTSLSSMITAQPLLSSPPSTVDSSVRMMSPSTIGLPVTALKRSATARCIAMPPAIASLSFEKSRLQNASFSRNAL